MFPDNPDWQLSVSGSVGCTRVVDLLGSVAFHDSVAGSQVVEPMTCCCILYRKLSVDSDSSLASHAGIGEVVSEITTVA